MDRKLYLSTVVLSLQKYPVLLEAVHYNTNYNNNVKIKNKAIKIINYVKQLPVQTYNFGLKTI